MTPTRRGPWRSLSWLLIALIAHGSIYPWHFVASPSFAEDLAALLAQRQWWTNTSDVLENVALFVPLGAVWAWSRGPLRDTRAVAWILMVLGSVGFAFVLQVMQLWIPERDAQLSDVLWNGVGQALGVGLGAVLRAPLGALAATRGLAPTALALLLLWVGLEMFPFVPTIDWQHIKDAVKPLLREPVWRWRSLFDTAFGLVLVAQLLREVRHRAGWLALLFGLAVLSKSLIAGLAYSPGHAAGWLFGVLLAPVVWRLPVHRGHLVGVAVALLWFTLDALYPFDVAERPNDFHWMPFEAALHGSTMANLAALGHDLFWLGAPLLLARELGARPGPMALVLSLWALMLEGVQTVLPERVPEITIALLPWVWWLWLRSDAPPRAPAAPTRRRRGA